MELLNQRISGQVNDSLGLFYIDGNFQCFTLEDEKRDVKVKGETRIPAGRYRITFRTEGGFHLKYLQKYGASWHKGMLWVRDVPGFEYILIHILNTEKQTDGCLGVGDQLNNNVDRPGYLGESERAYKRLYPIVRDALLRGEEVWITYRDEVFPTK